MSLKKSAMTNSSETLLSFPSKMIQGVHLNKELVDGIFDIHCLTQDGRLVRVSQHEYDLLTQTSLALNLDGTHILNLEECMMAYGQMSDT